MTEKAAKMKEEDMVVDTKPQEEKVRDAPIPLR